MTCKCNYQKWYMCEECCEGVIAWVFGVNYPLVPYFSKTNIIATTPPFPFAGSKILFPSSFPTGLIEAYNRMARENGLNYLTMMRCLP